MGSVESAWKGTLHKKLSLLLDNAKRKALEILVHMKFLPLLKFSHWRLAIFCLAGTMATTGITMAAKKPGVLETSREFWIADSRSTPTSFRKAKATLRASSDRSLVYVENRLWTSNPLQQDFIHRLHWHLETAMPLGAIEPEIGIIPFQESIFGPLPKKNGRADERLIVLFTDLTQSGRLGTLGYYYSIDQLSDEEAQRKYQQRSNEANIIYVNGFPKNEARTVGLVAHELQLLLADANSDSEREVWLSDILAEGAMLLTGSFTGQSQVEEMAKKSEKHPLVTLASPSHAPQLLFSSFLLDSLFGNSLAVISRSSAPGKSAVEKVYTEHTGAPLSFDAIFSNYISYIFTQSSDKVRIPSAWKHNSGILVPEIQPYYTFRASSGELSGQMPPYSFLAIDLAQELSPAVVIQTERRRIGDRPGVQSCSNTASVLWKPISPKRIAIYTIGCDPSISDEMVAFRLKILDQPSFLPSSPFASPFRILP